MSEFGTPPAAAVGTPRAAAGAAAGNTNPSQGFERFIEAFSAGETHAKAAAAAGLTLRDVAARRESDEDFEAAYKLARKTRLMALHDAVWAEAVGTEVRDPVNGVVRVVRNVRMLERLAVTEKELEPERTGPAVAIQNNVSGTDPKLARDVEANRAKLMQLLKRHDKPALPAVIDVEVIDVNEETI